MDAGRLVLALGLQDREGFARVAPQRSDGIVASQPLEAADERLGRRGRERGQHALGRFRLRAQQARLERRARHPGVVRALQTCEVAVERVGRRLRHVARRIDEKQARDPLRMRRGIGADHGAAVAVAHEDEAAEAERIRHRADVLCDVLDTVARLAHRL